MAYCILFVGSGDAGREIMAKAILDNYIKVNGLEGMEVKARGLVVLFQEPVNSKIATILENNSLTMEYDCVFQLEQSDIDTADIVITIDAKQKERVINNYNDVKEIYSLKELADEEGTVLDPYGKDLMDYEYCYRELDRLVEKWFISKLVKL
jgi:protein-tyrosine-phosphatase